MLWGLDVTLQSSLSKNDARLVVWNHDHKMTIEILVTHSILKLCAQVIQAVVCSRGAYSRHNELSLARVSLRESEPLCVRCSALIGELVQLVSIQ